MHNKERKTALVTGAGKRIGREIALHLAPRGWNVALHCHHSVREAEALAEQVRALGVEAAVICADLADADATSSVIATTTDTLGPISLLVHNASVFEKDGLSRLSHANFTRHMAVNLEAPLHLSRDFAAQAPHGSSILCLLDGMTGWSMSAAYLSYALSKSALAEAVRLLAPLLAPHIRINGIALGATLSGAEDADSFQRLAALAPLQRTGTPQEVLAALDFLLSAKGMTGQILDLANGMGLPPQWAANLL